MKNITAANIPGRNKDLSGVSKAILAIVFFLFCGFIESTFAQDIIILKSGKELKANIIEESTDIIKYREYENPTGPLYSVTKDKVASVKYKKGSKDTQEAKVRETEKNTSNAPAQVSKTGLLTAKKRLVYLDGVAQAPRSIRLLMEDQPEALRLYESGKKLCNLSNACAFGAMFTSFIFTQSVNKKVTSEEKIRAGIPGLVIDGGFIVAAIIMFSSGKSKIRKSVTLYNSSINKPVSYHLNLGIQENGIGLGLKF
ncbi:MAG TPA: hypothetical protein VIK07_09680 [Bacteroidales bacterium]